MKRFIYKGAKTKEISFPLGGIGTGCIGLAGNGRLIDWEIFNKPNKGGLNGYSHFAIKAEANGKVVDARVLNGDLLPPYSGQSGPARETLAGLPHFKAVEFGGEFPIATLDFKDTKFPGRVRLTAFNPFIPLNDQDSGIPAAFFEFEIENTTRQKITYTLGGTLQNPLPEQPVNSVSKKDKLTTLHLTTDMAAEDLRYGDMTLATDAQDISYQQYWFNPGWWNDLNVYWQDFTAPGKLKNRAKSQGSKQGTLAAYFTLAPGKTAKVRFVISWNFPNCANYWDGGAAERAKKAKVPAVWKNYYATLFKDSSASADYCLKNWDRLYNETALFKDALFSSDLPPAALDAISANISILKSPTALRLEDGTFYGWEGCNAHGGCCEGTCTHVWNYAQALPFLFPKLERSIRTADFRYNQKASGGMGFRMLLPLGSGQSGFRPCADGEFGGVIKTYRDWKISGDSAWLRSIWPAVKKSIEFAWSPENEDRWDPNKTGVLHGRQHHTLDMELFGPNSWLTGFYLGALKAGAEMAEYLGEKETAQEYRGIFKKGKQWVEDHLFNGEYYQQQIDLSNKKLLEPYGATDAYWDEEHKQIKFQIGEGCEIDQVLAQWHADICGLGEIFDPKRTRTALASVFKYNFKDPIGEYYNPCRLYCLNDEAGLVMCDWPAGKEKAAAPLTYAQETMHGFEYAAAAQMLKVGLVKQGEKVVEEVRKRYDGEKRNPWNEFECGNNYARSMASYSLLNSYSGFEFNLVEGLVGFNPIKAKNGKFRCFWSLDSGWGMVEMKPEEVTLQVLYGTLKIKALNLPFLGKASVKSVTLGAAKREFRQEGGKLSLKGSVTLTPKLSLMIRTGKS